jgi:hypothetical protein
MNSIAQLATRSARLNGGQASSIARRAFTNGTSKTLFKLHQSQSLGKTIANSQQ